jgi:hypothetical protein
MGRTIYVETTGGQENENQTNTFLSEVIRSSEAGDIIQLTPGQTIVLDELVMLDKSISIMGNATEEKPTIIMEKNSAIVVLSSYITISGIKFIDKRTNSRTTPMFVVNSSSRNYVFTDNVVKYQKTCMRINGEGFYVARNNFSRGDMSGIMNNHIAIMITGTAGVNAIRENSFLSTDNNLRSIYISSEGTSTNFNGILSLCENKVGVSSQPFLLMDDFTTDVPGNFFLDVRDNDCQTAKFITLYPTGESSLGAFGDILLSENHIVSCLNGLVFIDNDVVELSKLKETPSICTFNNRIDKKVVALDRVPICNEVLTARYGQLVPPAFRQCVSELDYEPYTEIDVDKNVGEVLTLKHGSRININDKGLTIPVVNLSRNDSNVEAPHGMLSVKQRNCHVLLNAGLYVPKTSLENYSFPLSMYIRKISLNVGEIQQIVYENRFIPGNIDALQGFFYVGETIQTNGLIAKRIGSTESFEIMGTNDFEPGRYLFGYQGVYKPDSQLNLVKLSGDTSSFLLVGAVLVVVLLLAFRMNRK